ncbi:DUF982 domain-containing protein [Allomesorhizobium camelthorni]|uniref:DUF982 domain-containing protein n=1 Tax=Allomesorhizobium camelthorni TaxID=475069 RepID=A0A6G4W6S0_9HYPH|nr:DUF982 domain-containing protein [Mesorhizobium camelthorni]NGO50451.1 DUF982 domain-containing protein [Mesorhizobium camelthorni]
MATLEDKPFDQAVCVHGARAGQVQNVGSAREAAEWLLYEWPAETIDSDKARAARQACLAALESRGETADARQAFRAAAHEAGIFIGDVDRVPKPGKIVKRRR